jgi:arylsulfatase A-like enzyme
VSPDSTGHLTDIFTREAISFIEDNKDNPFFIYVAFNAPHTPLEGKPEDLRKLFPETFASMTDEEIRKTGRTKQFQKEHFQALVYGVDRAVGDIMNALKESGVYENTVVFFISDNGSKIGSNYPLSGLKHDVLEGGIRIPFIVWSNQLKLSKVSGTYYDGLVSVCDISPTALTLAGEVISFPTDGDNIMPYLLEKSRILTGRDYYFADIQRYCFGTKSKDQFEVKDEIDKTSVIQVFVYDSCKRIYYQAHKTIEPRMLYFSLQDAVGKENPENILSESYDFENQRIANANEKQIIIVKQQYEAFKELNKNDLMEEWSGEYLEKH